MFPTAPRLRRQISVDLGRGKMVELRSHDSVLSAIDGVALNYTPVRIYRLCLIFENLFAL